MEHRIRAVIREYKEISGSEEEGLTPLRHIFQIAEGTREGKPEAAKEAFARFGEVAGDVFPLQCLTDSPRSGRWRCQGRDEVYRRRLLPR